LRTSNGVDFVSGYLRYLGKTRRHLGIIFAFGDGVHSIARGGWTYCSHFMSLAPSLSSAFPFSLVRPPSLATDSRAKQNDVLYLHTFSRDVGPIQLCCRTGVADHEVALKMFPHTRQNNWDSPTKFKYKGRP
jgi:hypothetical protein